MYNYVNECGFFLGFWKWFVLVRNFVDVLFVYWWVCLLVKYVINYFYFKRKQDGFGLEIDLWELNMGFWILIQNGWYLLYLFLV